MANVLRVLWGILNLLVLFFQSRRDQEQRGEGQNEILARQEQIDAEAASRAAVFDALANDAHLADLHERMRNYQRTSSSTEP